MDNNISLPYTDKYGCYNIRLESIGGLGANLLGKILGEAGIMMDLNSASFSSYGSEKRGSPVKSYIRYSKNDILINSPVQNPDILAVFHKNLTNNKTIFSDILPHTNIVINSDDDIDLPLPKGTLYIVNALKIAKETKSRINMVMLGAVTRASGFIPLESIIETVRITVGKKYPSLLENNIEAVKRGFSECIVKEYISDKIISDNTPSPMWGYETAPMGGVIPLFGSMISNDLSASREGFIPIFIKDRCINCGLCDTTCPDMVFQFVEGEYKGRKTMVNSGPDYLHCKGCLRCVDICPVEALVKGVESEKGESVPNRALIRDIPGFTPTGANSYITSESDHMCNGGDI